MPYVYVEFFDKNKTVKFTQQGFELFKEMRPYYQYNKSELYFSDGYHVWAYRDRPEKEVKIDYETVSEFAAALAEHFEILNRNKRFASYWNC